MSTRWWCISTVKTLPVQGFEASEHITDALDFINSGDGHPHRGTGGPLRHAAHLVKHIVKCLHV